MLFLGGGGESNPLTLHCIVFSQAIFIAMTQTEQKSKALYSYLVQLSIADKLLADEKAGSLSLAGNMVLPSAVLNNSLYYLADHCWFDHLLSPEVL